MNILIIEDDKDVALTLVKGFNEKGHKANCAYDGQAGFEMAINNEFDVLVIDRMLPKLDGITVVKLLREKNIKTPILILTALGNIDDKVLGLSSGADDYLVKPFAFAELIARLQLMTTRAKPPANEIIIGDIKIDKINQKVTRRGISIKLNLIEYKLLLCLAENSGELVSKKILLEKVWGYSFDPGTNLINVQISRLRQKIDSDKFKEKVLKTVHGSGFILNKT